MNDDINAHGHQFHLSTAILLMLAAALLLWPNFTAKVGSAPTAATGIRSESHYGWPFVSNIERYWVDNSHDSVSIAINRLADAIFGIIILVIVADCAEKRILLKAVFRLLRCWIKGRKPYLAEPVNRRTVAKGQENEKKQ